MKKERVSMGGIDQSTGEILMLWTVRFAVAAVLIRMLLRVSTPRPVDSAPTSAPTTAEVSWWTLGCLAYLWHVVLAFEFVHGWSHEQAWQHTAEETARMTGVDRGDGLWANYAFTLIWVIDVVRLLVARISGRPTRRGVDIAIYILFGFMFFNATVVFGPHHYRLLVLPVLVIFWLAWRKRRAADVLGTG